MKKWLPLAMTFLIGLLVGGVLTLSMVSSLRVARDHQLTNQFWSGQDCKLYIDNLLRTPPKPHVELVVGSSQANAKVQDSQFVQRDEHELEKYILTSQLPARNSMRWVGVVMAVCLGACGVGLIIGGWRYKIAESVGLEIATKVGAAIKVSGATAGIIALTLSVYLIRELVNDVIDLKF